MRTILVLSLILCRAALALDDGLPEVATQRFEEAKQRLDLSSEQVELVTPVLKSAFERQKAVLESFGLDIERLGTGDQPRLRLRQARKLSRQLDEERAQTLEELESILSPTQLREYERLQAERKQAVRKEIRSRR